MKTLNVSLALACAVLLTACDSSDDETTSGGTPPGVEDPGEGDGDGKPTSPQPQPEPEPAPEPAVLLQEHFDQAALPVGWTQHNGAANAVYVQDGALFVNGLANDYTATAVTLPLSGVQNFQLQASFTITEANNNSRWASFMYRTSPSSNLEPFYQAAFRQNAAASNGTELAYRNNAAWSVTHTAAFDEALSPGQRYRVRIEAYDGRVRQYLNDRLMHDAEIGDIRAGGFAIQAAGTVIRVDEILIKEQLQALPSMGDIYPTPQVQTGVAMAPTLVAARSVAGTEPGKASALWLRLDAGLNLSSAGGQSIGSLTQWLDDGPRALPVLFVDSQATIDALAPLATERNLVDLTLVANDPVLLARAREVIPMSRTALDLSASSLRPSRQDLLAVLQQTNRSGSKIVLLPPGMLERDAVAYLQRMLVTPWAVSSNTSPVEAARILATGVNGIVTPDIDVFAALLERFPAHTLLRQPLVIGHRGVPSTVDENTLEGALKAVELGANAVESDIYLTTDKQIIVIHDDTLNRTTTGTGSVESYSLAELQAFRTKPQGLAIPTLAQYFEALRGKPVTQFVEIKSGNPEIVPALQALIQQYGVQDQVIVISFNQDQLTRLRQVMPEVSAGFLTSTPKGEVPVALRTILAGTQSLSSTFNPSYTDLTPALMEAAKHRGITFWPWTFREQSIAEQFYQYGTHGLTTDYAQWFSEYAIRVEAVEAQPRLAVGVPVTLPVQLRRQSGTVGMAQSQALLVVDSTASYMQQDGALVFTTAGQATVMLGYTQVLSDGRQYTLFSDPVRVTVQ